MYFKFVYLLFFILSFSSKVSAQNIKIVDFKEYNLNNSSIRAIEIVNDSILWFAGSNGNFGRIINNHIEIGSLQEFNSKKLNFRSIAFNGDHLFLLSIENPAILLKLNPFGKKISQPKIVYQEHHEKVFYDSMKFFNNKDGIAIGDSTDGCLSVILTKDGGNSWHKILCQNLPEIYDGEAAFAASNTNIAIIKNTVWIATGGKRSRIFKSSNKGKNWIAHTTPIIQGKTMTGAFTVDFYDRNNGIIMGGNWEEKNSFKDTKASTHDGGKTWNLIANNQTPGYISCVQYIPQTKGKKIMAVSTEGIYYSNNKGGSWKKISDKSFYTIKFTNKNTAWLAGNNKIAKIKLQSTN